MVFFILLMYFYCQDLKVYLLTNLGRVLVWEEKSGSQFCSCVFSLNREMLVADIAVSRSQILLLSKDGVGYEGTNNSPKRFQRLCSTVDLFF